jgi:hypothetical protein
MHVQMFTHRRLQMQGHLDTIVLRRPTPATDGCRGAAARDRLSSTIEWGP